MREGRGFSEEVKEDHINRKILTIFFWTDRQTDRPTDIGKLHFQKYTYFFLKHVPIVSSGTLPTVSLSTNLTFFKYYKN